MLKARSFGIAAGAAAVIIGAGMNVFDNNQDDSRAIIIEMNTSGAVSTGFSQPQILPAETEDRISAAEIPDILDIPEEAAEILPVTVESEEADGIIIVTVESEKAAAKSPAKEPPETAVNTADLPGIAAKATAASTAPKKAQTNAAAPAEPEEAAVSIPEKNTQTVYIASSGKGSRYHSDPNCSNMKGTSAVSIDDARALGYTACKKCY